MASDASVLVAAPVVAANAAAPPAWSPADFFDLTEADVNMYRKVLAQQLQVRYGNAVQKLPFCCGAIRRSGVFHRRFHEGTRQLHAGAGPHRREGEGRNHGGYQLLFLCCQRLPNPMETAYLSQHWLRVEVDGAEH